jgi:predicted DNA-binding transcriptional regulator AlpA
MPKPQDKTPKMRKKEKDFERKYISPKELAKRWDVSESAIYHAKCGSRELTPIRFGRSLRFLRAEVEALENKHHKQRSNKKQIAA